MQEMRPDRKRIDEIEPRPKFGPRSRTFNCGKLNRDYRPSRKQARFNGDLGSNRESTISFVTRAIGACRSIGIAVIVRTLMVVVVS